MCDVIEQELSFQASQTFSEISMGAIHGDLFPDNFFFNNGDVSGLIDFHFVCTDYYIYDLAIMINAWCFDQGGELSKERFDAILSGYQKHRPLTEAENMVFPALLRLASLRFLMSRINEYLQYNPDTTTMKPHDPLEFLHRLKTFQQFDTIEKPIA